jgi:phosphate transport system ATP-binding protein
MQMALDATTTGERRAVTAPQIRTGRTVAEAEQAVSRQVRLRAEHVSVRYGAKLAIDDITLDVHARAVTAIIGPSGCGAEAYVTGRFG